ncbi:MAG: putative cell-wall-anchored protein SasA (LPXTG motif) [Anaerolineae bacterium]|nr:MAG: putative cell-wall-anchored protein SasA (LPXTG motif) [Anaerolineae bacterium]
MKRLVNFILLLIMIVGFSQSAYAFPSGSWVSGVTVANLTNEQATILITFYNQDGSVALSFDGGTIPGNGSKTWYLPSHVSGLSSGFIGSAVVSSDKQIAAIVNTQLPSGSNPTRVGTSTGVNSPAETVYATQIMKNYYGWNSYCAVQNTGSSPFTVSAYYYDQNGTQVGAPRTQSIPANASYIFDQSTDSGLSNGFTGSAKFVGDSTHLLAVVCNFYNAGTGSNDAQFHSYNGMGIGGTTLYVPRVVKDYYGYQSGIKIQNIGTETLTVTINFNFNGVQYTLTSPSISPGRSWGPYMGDPSQLSGATPSLAAVSGSGSAVISVNAPNSNKLIIATINEDNRVNPAGRGVTYEAGLLSEASNVIVFPQITSEYYGYSSGWQVMKVESGNATCTASYSASGSIAAFTENFTLTDSLPSFSRFAPNAPGMLAGIANDNYNGAVTITCTGAKVIGIANLSYRYDYDNRYGNVSGDSFTTARGINK